MARPYISAEIDRRVREAARHRCGYCLSPQHLVMARLEIEHIVPLIEGGSTNHSLNPPHSRCHISGYPPITCPQSADRPSPAAPATAPTQAPMFQR